MHLFVFIITDCEIWSIIYMWCNNEYSFLIGPPKVKFKNYVNAMAFIAFVMIVSVEYLYVYNNNT